MKVIVIVKATADSEAGTLPSEQLMTDMGNYNQQLVEAGIMLAGEGLLPSSKGARVRFSGKERTVIDGPFPETKELVAGFWIWQVKSMEEAIEWVKRCPNPHPGDCEIEIRPIATAEDFGEAMTPEVRMQEADLRARTLGLGEIRLDGTHEMVIAGINKGYARNSAQGIPQQWERFAPLIDQIPGQVAGVSYGVSWNMQPDCSFDYLTGVEVSDPAKIPDGFDSLRIASRRYVVFTHEGHASQIQATFDTIWSKWVPDCGLAIAKAPCFERYTSQFNPESGTGKVEIWIPLES